MVKDQHVGRPSFSRVFFSCNTFSTEVDQTKVRALKREHVEYADEEHGGEILHRVDRNLSGAHKTAPLSFLHPKKSTLPMNHALCLAMSCGYLPATQHETMIALSTATREQSQGLCFMAEEIASSRGLTSRRASVICANSIVCGKTGELFILHEFDESSGLSREFQLRKLDPNAPLPPAMLIPVIGRV